VALLSAPGAPTPVLGKSVTAARAEGTVLVEPPGSHHFVALSDAVSTPSNSLVDARRGTIVVATALAGTTSVQMASFNGGEFRVTQSATAGGLTDIELTGGSFATCPRHRPRARAGVAASSHRSTVRRLWANDNHGRFRVHGRDSVATVRGTSLLTVDRCDGTLTSVSKGAVSVRDLHRHRAVLVSAGHSHLAPTR
jgi:ferric-dicitrate binding protein FerR (iron transport regulator)